MAAKKTAIQTPQRELILPTDIPVASSSATSREITWEEKKRRIAEIKAKTPGRFLSTDQVSNRYILRRPTGIMELDIAIGGGWPAGGGNGLGGPYNSGKSFLCWMTMAMQQRIYGDAFMGAVAIVEEAFPYDQALMAGCRIAVPDDVLSQWEEWKVSRGGAQYTSAEIDYFKTSVGNIELIHGESGEDFLNGVVTLTASNTCSFIFLDSMNALDPDANFGKDMDENNKLGAHATMMEKFWKKFSYQVRPGRNSTCLVFTQQVRANMERSSKPAPMQKYIKQWEVKSGEAHKHYTLINLNVWSGAKLRQGDKGGPVTGKEINFETGKGKAGCHDNVTGSFLLNYYPTVHVDIHAELLRSAYARGRLMKDKNHLYILRAEDNSPIEGHKYKSERELREAMALSFDIEMVLRRECLAHANVRALYR